MDELEVGWGFFDREFFFNSSWGTGATAAFRAGSWDGAGNHTGVRVLSALSTSSQASENQYPL